MSPRIVYSTDPQAEKECPRCGRQPCVCHTINLPVRQQTAYVRRDRKGRSGKTVTVVYGLQHNPATLKELLGVLKTYCGAGGTVRGDDLEIQGDQRDKVAEKLYAMGYKVKLAGG